MLRAILATSILTALTLAASNGAVLADAIDGTWCAEDGRILQIQGSAISTPGGAEMTGNYGRHSFSYVVPAGETPTGETVRMVMMNEDIVHLKVGDQAGDAEVWQRCDTTS